MVCNVSKIDRIVRTLLAVILIAGVLLFVQTTLPKVLILTAAILLLLSAWFGVCYLYRLIGFSTAKPNPQT